MGGRYFIALEAGFRNPQTFGFLEVLIELSAGVSGLDVIAGSDFETNSLKGWSRNFPDADPQVPGSTTGSPDSAITLRRGPPNGSRSLQITTHGSLDSFVLPMEYLGDLSLLGPNLRMEFDLDHIGDRARVPLEVKLIGEFAAFLWVGQIPLRQGGDHYVVQFNSGAFERISGPLTFEEALVNVLRIEIRAILASTELLSGSTTSFCWGGRVRRGLLSFRHLSARPMVGSLTGHAPCTCSRASSASPRATSRRERDRLAPAAPQAGSSS